LVPQSDVSDVFRNSCGGRCDGQSVWCKPFYRSRGSFLCFLFVFTVIDPPLIWDRTPFNWWISWWCRSHSSWGSLHCSMLFPHYKECMLYGSIFFILSLHWCLLQLFYMSLWG
jgi:hypothetical protein